MPRAKKFVIRLSHSAMATYKRCSWAWLIAYFWGIRPKDKSESLYDGTNWHDGLEILQMKPETVCRKCAEKAKADPGCPFCQGTTFMVGEPMEVIARCFDKAYSVYGNMTEDTATKIETRRTILLYSLAAYQWYYSEDKTVKKVLACELPFNTELVNTVTGREFADVVVLGKIDKIFLHENKKKYIMEHKSTSSDLADDSLYWDKLRFDPQTNMYPWAVRDMQAKGELGKYGIKAKDPLIAGVFYDVWRKPKIKPSKLSAADAKELITTGNYCGEHFEVTAGISGKSIVVNGVTTEIYPNAKGTGFRARETQQMFGSRLLELMCADPEYYFARREITRTTEDLDKFEEQMVNITRTLRHMITANCFFPDSTSCDDFGGCDSRPICYNDLSVGMDDVPTGYKCIFDEKGK